jgi:hypothetical protein
MVVPTEAWIGQYCGRIVCGSGGCAHARMSRARATSEIVGTTQAVLPAGASPIHKFAAAVRAQVAAHNERHLAMSFAEHHADEGAHAWHDRPGSLSHPITFATRADAEAAWSHCDHYLATLHEHGARGHLLTAEHHSDEAKARHLARTHLDPAEVGHAKVCSDPHCHGAMVLAGRATRVIRVELGWVREHSHDRAWHLTVKGRAEVHDGIGMRTDATLCNANVHRLPARLAHLSGALPETIVPSPGDPICRRCVP